MRVAKAQTLGQANAYLENEFLPWWNQTLTVRPAAPDDAHRPLGKAHSLAATLSHVETRQVANDYTIRFESKLYQIARATIYAGLRGGAVRVEKRLDGTLAVRFRDRYLSVSECAARPQAAIVQTPPAQPHKNIRRQSTTRGAKPQTGRLGKTRPAGFAFTLCKASARKFHPSKAVTKSQTLGGCLHPEPRVCCRLLRSQLHRIGLPSSQRARPHSESISL